MYSNAEMISIAEVPMDPHGWILNGWLSAIVNIDKANEILNNNKITKFIKQNLNTLEKMLHLYDVKSYCISRYNLTQFYYFRVLKKKYKISKIIFEYPNDKDVKIIPYNYKPNLKKSRWEFFILKKGNLQIKQNTFVGEKVFQFNGVLTLNGFPKKNTIKIIFNQLIYKKNIKIQIYVGQYDPLHASPIHNKWVTIKDKNIKVDQNILEINLPYNIFNNTIGYPTNFMKKFSRGKRNTYHDIHIIWLSYLGNKYHKQKFITMANKWLRCKTKWKNIIAFKDLFKNNKVLLDNDFLNFLNKYYK
jgi:hypothetical protein